MQSISRKRALYITEPKDRRMRRAPEKYQKKEIKRTLKCQFISLPIEVGEFLVAFVKVEGILWVEL